MKRLLKAAILVILAALTCNCANQVKVPNHVTVTTDGTTIIEHRVTISIEMQQSFIDECVKELGADATDLQIETCRKMKVAKFTQDFLALLASAQEGQAK